MGNCNLQNQKKKRPFTDGIHRRHSQRINPESCELTNWRENLQLDQAVRLVAMATNAAVQRMYEAAVANAQAGRWVQSADAYLAAYIVRAADQSHTSLSSRADSPLSAAAGGQAGGDLLASLEWVHVDSLRQPLRAYRKPHSGARQGWQRPVVPSGSSRAGPAHPRPRKLGRRQP